MSVSIEALVLRETGAEKIVDSEVIQRLWSDYGSIVRYRLEGGAMRSVIVKHVSPPSAADHPRGWNTDHSHQRKLKSYAVETAWYREYAARCGDGCKVPTCYAIETDGDEVAMLLEDLDAVGFADRRSSVSAQALARCLNWLGEFHATFLTDQPVGLWESGTYWHLETRPDELAVLLKDDPQLHAAAAAIDQQLKACRFQTLVHGDAKLANFCFAEDDSAVAAVDFQYVGGGCGMKDVAYFIGSCLDERSAEANEAHLLDTYFSALKAAVCRNHPSIDVDQLEAEWRALYAVAWADFHRFIKGWSPGHWKISEYSERLTREVIADLSNS
ncbi:MAG: phosphotransferase [Opitutaceae bacterium]